MDLFFLLSGFVLTLAFEPRFGAGIDAVTFLRRRFRRFLPMVAAGAIPGAFALFGATGNGGLALAAFVLSLAMVPMLTGGMTFPANTPQWSLFAELALNLLHGMKLHRLTDAKLALLALACLAGLVMLMARAGDGDLGGDLRQLPAGLLRGDGPTCWASSWRGGGAPAGPQAPPTGESRCSCRSPSWRCCRLFHCRSGSATPL